MEQVVGTQHHANAEEIISVASSGEPEESSMISESWRRVRRYGLSTRQAQEQIAEAPEEGDDHLQEMLNEVSGQVPDDDGPPDDEPPSSSAAGGEKCGVCERSFRNRGPTVTCAGCTKRVHKNYCVRYMKLSENLRAGMCNVCCGKVEDYILDVEEYSVAQGVTWNRE